MKLARILMQSVGAVYLLAYALVFRLRRGIPD